MIVMKYVLAAMLASNGVISFLGFAKAFDLVELDQLQPISHPLGVLWLAAAILFTIAAVMLLVRPRWWWMPAAFGVACSTFVIVAAWDDAKFGLLANAIVLVPVAVSALAAAPWSFQALYERDARQGLAASAGGTSIVTEADLAHLPEQIQRYLRFAGVVGKPRVSDYRVLFDGGLRSAPDKPFMTGLIEQHSFASPPARLFLAHMSMFGVPAEAYHRYVGPSATFNVKIASLAHIVNESGPEMNRAETVTLLNDMLLLAPATIIDAGIEWEELDSRRLRATWSNAGNTVSAELTFDESGALSDFVSADRARSADLRDLGATELDPGSVVGSANRLRWSTPIGGWKELDGRKLPVDAVAVWHLPAGDFVYGKFEILEIEFNAAAN
jgi:hypothetical protein